MYILIDTNGYYSQEEFKQPLLIISHENIILAACKKAKALGYNSGQLVDWNTTGASNDGLHIIVSSYKSTEKIYDSILQILSTYSHNLEYFSSNEIFVKFDHNKFYEYRYLEELRNYITNIVGIPISIGVGETQDIARKGKDKTSFSIGERKGIKLRVLIINHLKSILIFLRGLLFLYYKDFEYQLMVITNNLNL